MSHSNQLQHMQSDGIKNYQIGANTFSNSTQLNPSWKNNKPMTQTSYMMGLQNVRRSKRNKTKTKLQWICKCCDNSSSNNSDSNCNQCGSSKTESEGNPDLNKETLINGFFKEYSIYEIPVTAAGIMLQYLSLQKVVLLSNICYTNNFYLKQHKFKIEWTKQEINDIVDKQILYDIVDQTRNK